MYTIDVMEIKKLDDQSFLDVLRSRAQGPRAEYKAFYSTFLGGLTTSPHHMVVPLDDHMVHRGDAVFEAMKFSEKAIYLLGPHLDRLEVSAGTIGLKIPLVRKDLESVILQTARASGLSEGVVRLYVSRGPGGFSPNPYESVGAQVYCAITKLAAASKEKYEKGVRVGISAIAVKEGVFARTKTCNYLPNVLMKKESVDRGLDFVVSLDEQGAIAESATENFALIDESGALLVPPFERILRGCTAVRAMELARGLGVKVENRRFTPADVKRARGALMLGTTLDVIGVCEFDSHVFASEPEITRKLMRALESDIKTGPFRTAF